MPLDTRFVNVLPRIDMANLPLLQLQPVHNIRNIDELQKLLKGSLTSTPSWLNGRDGVQVQLLQPSAAALSKLFPTLTYHHVEFKDPELGLLKNFPANVFPFPMRKSAYYCGAKIPMRISELGKAQLQETLNAETGADDAEVNMLVTRRSRDRKVEQDPTLTLIQWFRGPQNEAIMKETVIRVEAHEAVSSCGAGEG